MKLTNSLELSEITLIGANSLALGFATNLIDVLRLTPELPLAPLEFELAAVTAEKSALTLCGLALLREVVCPKDALYL